MNEPLKFTEQELAAERELAALRPACVSAELEQSIGRRLAELQTDQRPRGTELARRYAPGRWLWLTAGALAASIAAAIALWPAPKTSPTDPPIARNDEPTIQFGSLHNQPSLLAYGRALATSDETFERLLDEHARGGSAAAHGMDATRAFARAASQEFLNTGEL
jgi:hypothetical protein